MRIEAYSQVNQLYQTTKPKKITRQGEQQSTDQYQISQSARDYQIAKNAISESPDVREEKVARLKEAIRSGSYNVSAQEVADAMVSKFFDEIG